MTKVLLNKVLNKKEFRAAFTLGREMYKSGRTEQGVFTSRFVEYDYPWYAGYSYERGQATIPGKDFMELSYDTYITLHGDVPNV